MPVTTARHKIFSYLKKTRTASAREIARAMKMSMPDVRYHLRVLESDGRLEAVTSRRREGRGRPEKVYSLPAAALGDNFSVLAEALLTETGSKVQLEAVARRLAGESDLTGQPIARKLNLLLERLNIMNYHARWEAGSGGPRIIFDHCPYAAIVRRHPGLCEMDRVMLEACLGPPVTRTSRVETSLPGVCPFMFLAG